ncbi:M23 family metallopeptidase [Arthrobacter sp. zg-Y1171]|uniref:M23 family metallopeptidase n=1 Tax=Arthrobacter sp. zg-Y1171 TaxID=2964610 RepID=UPI0021030032|nr:peptidoglycan DD-metalloendopeptidase family protein [Arthrobacter sp. zg-Y1171]MCQ1996130.1 peptidoglycan DD-metalloendopeptidase family protein [Arthrobacter sp. zg-Y1171]UWX82808.1 peptidoglycan DD-metalloendopeptidase family protein [Arthrobacter sp. zg-Y1171]
MKRTPVLLLAAVLSVLAPGSVAVDPPSAATASAYSPPWSWPLAPEPALLRSFDPPAQPWLAGHRGIDVAAAEGAAVLAPADGRVVFARRVVDRSVLTIDHGRGLLSSFEPVEASVPVGTEVPKGTAVGSVRSGSHCGPGCVHWGVRLDGDYVDPLNYVSDRRPSVLLPVPPPASREPPG